MTNHVSVQNDTIWFSAPYNGYGATVLILMMIKQSSLDKEINQRHASTIELERILTDFQLN